MENKLLHAVRNLVAGLGLFILAVPSSANAEGTYAAKLDLSSSVSTGRLEYKLELKSRREANLEIKRTSRIRAGRSGIDEFGEQLSFLIGPDKVNLTGRWTETDDGVRIEITRIRSSEESENRNLFIELNGDGKEYRVDNWDMNFFGEPSRLRFTRVTRNSGNELLEGLAIIAAGALLANASDGNSSSGESYRFETGGRGNIQFGAGDQYEVRLLKVDFRRGGNGTIILDDGYRLELRGNWRSTSNGYTFRLSEIKMDNKMYRSSGEVSLRSAWEGNRRQVNSLAGSFQVGDDEWRSISVSFNAARG